MSDTRNPAISEWIWRRQWLPRPLRKLAFKRLRESGREPDAPFTMNFYGLDYEGNLKNNVEFAMYFYGAFEKPLLHFMRDAITKLSPNQAICFDIGSNIGQHTLFLSRHARRVHAFEPFPEVSAKLKHHIDLNDITNIELHEVGLSDENGHQAFYAPTGGNQGIGSFLAESREKGNSLIGELDIVRGDDYFHQQGIEQVDLMKIDVEGLEQKVLTGLKNTLLRTRPVIVCEISYGESFSFPSREAFMESLPPDYRLFIFDTRKADGRTARRRGARAKRSGQYRLQELKELRERDQDDIVAVPREKLDLIPLSGS